MAEQAGGRPSEQRGGGAPPGVQEGAAAPPQVPPPTMTARLGSTALLLEAFVVLFAALAATGLLTHGGGLTVAQVWLAALVLVVACVLAAGLARRPSALAAGAVVQGLVVATGFWVPLMFAVGLGFAALWVWLVSIGRRIDGDRRRWAAQLAAHGGGAHGAAGAEGPGLSGATGPAGPTGRRTAPR